MKAYIVRHGQTAWNKIGRWQGNQDIPIDEMGVMQANLLAEKLSHYQISMVYSSSLERASQTAEIICRKLERPILVKEELKEVALGQWEGMTTDEIKMAYGNLFSQWETVPTAKIGLGVENMADLQQRAYQSFMEICLQSPEKDLSIVSHGTWIKCLMCKILHIPLENRAAFEIANAGLSILDFDYIHSRIIVKTLNDTSHIIC